MSGVILALHLTQVGLDAWAIGLIVSLGLTGCAVGTFLVIFISDRLGRRGTLIVLALLMFLGGLVFIFAAKFSVFVAAALFGMVNGMGRDRGPAVTLEQAILPQTTTESKRTTVFAWYNLVLDFGHTLGALLGGLPAFLRSSAGLSSMESYRWTWALYSLFCLLSGILVSRLTKSVEIAPADPMSRLSRGSRSVVAKFAALSGLDSLGGGFLTTALLSYWFFKRFGVDESLLAPLFALVRILNGLSHLGAAWLAKRIGLVNTMVFTHIPSSLLLMTVPLAPNLGVAVILFLLRESLVEMDVPTRQSYIVAVVRPEERTRAAGITNLTRSIAWAVAPTVAGFLMHNLALSTPLWIGPGLKICYDLLLYRSFHGLPPPEERRT
jgi:MFS family permease